MLYVSRGAKDHSVGPNFIEVYMYNHCNKEYRKGAWVAQWLSFCLQLRV